MSATITGMSEAVPYNIDFPELIQPPSLDYQNTIVHRDGVDKYEATARILVLDAYVRGFVNTLDTVRHFGFSAPETITVPKAMSRLEIDVPLDTKDPYEKEFLHCVVKAVRILKGEMLPNDFWSNNAGLVQ